MQSHGIAPDVINHSAATSSGEKGQRPQQALKVLQTLQSYGIAPDVFFYSAARVLARTAIDHSKH